MKSGLRLIDLLIAAMALVAAACMADQCLGQNAVIDGPANSAAGDLVVLDASRSEAKDFAWKLVNSDKVFLPVEGNRKVVFASGQNGVYTFILAVALDDKVAIAQHDVTIGPPNPPPPTPIPPSPPNPPEPEPLPHGKYDLSRLSRDWAKLSVTLDGPRRTASARSLAASFHTMASAIAAGTLTVPSDILAETKKSNQNALGSDAESWRPWFVLLAARLESLGKGGELNVADDYAAAWREIAAGLEAVK